MAEKLKQLEKESADEIAKKNAALKESAKSKAPTRDAKKLLQSYKVNSYLTLTSDPLVLFNFQVPTFSSLKECNRFLIVLILESKVKIMQF